MNLYFFNFRDNFSGNYGVHIGKKFGATSTPLFLATTFWALFFYNDVRKKTQLASEVVKLGRLQKRSFSFNFRCWAIFSNGNSWLREREKYLHSKMTVEGPSSIVKLKDYQFAPQRNSPEHFNWKYDLMYLFQIWNSLKIRKVQLQQPEWE